jgi:hypothetical protein
MSFILFGNDGFVSHSTSLIDVRIGENFTQLYPTIMLMTLREYLIQFLKDCLWESFWYARPQPRSPEEN